MGQLLWIYLNSCSVEDADSDDDKDEVGGLFKVASKTAKDKKEKKMTANARDCSLFPAQNIKDWETDLEEVLLFVQFMRQGGSMLYFSAFVSSLQGIPCLLLCNIFEVKDKHMRAAWK